MAGTSPAKTKLAGELLPLAAARFFPGQPCASWERGPARREDEGGLKIPGASPMPDDQQDVIAFLKEPSTYGERRVEIIETHASLVFIAGDRAYKLKRAVKYPYLDFSTAERRRQACA